MCVFCNDCCFSFCIQRHNSLLIRVSLKVVAPISDSATTRSANYTDKILVKQGDNFGYQLSAISYQLSAISYKLQATSYKLQATSYKLQATS
ncbi:hypothetical protein BCT00_07075 [Vibrio breoganii]|nr:hypothetical protein BCT00_07075 [Vibrio breoganii]